MISLILTILYLARDTVHRWFTRVSSPIARILVVYFLTLSALAALGSYVISLNVVRDEIIKRGGDTVVSSFSSSADHAVYLPSYKEMSDILDADTYILRSLGNVRLENDRNVSAYTYPFNRFQQMLPLMSSTGRPTLVQNPEKSHLPEGPSSVKVQGTREEVLVRNLPEGHPLRRVLPDGIVLIVAPDGIPPSMNTGNGGYTTMVVRVRHLTSSQSILKVEQFIRHMQRFEHLVGSVISVSDLLRRMDIVLDKQMQCRIAFCLGISTIVGILLTALAGMEYRQNEYIYTLMKSFGIHPLLLVGAFIVENIILVGISFVGAIATFMYFQRIIVVEILKLGNYSLSLEQVASEIAIISYTLLGCILVSSIPIIAAAYRQIGRVLK